MRGEKEKCGQCKHMEHCMQCHYRTRGCSAIIKDERSGCCFQKAIGKSFYVRLDDVACDNFVASDK